MFTSNVKKLKMSFLQKYPTKNLPYSYPTNIRERYLTGYYGNTVLTSSKFCFH